MNMTRRNFMGALGALFAVQRGAAAAGPPDPGKVEKLKLSDE